MHTTLEQLTNHMTTLVKLYLLPTYSTFGTPLSVSSIGLVIAYIAPGKYTNFAVKLKLWISILSSVCNNSKFPSRPIPCKSPRFISLQMFIGQPFPLHQSVSGLHHEHALRRCFIGYIWGLALRELQTQVWQWACIWGLGMEGITCVLHTVRLDTASAELAQSVADASHAFVPVRPTMPGLTAYKWYKPERTRRGKPC